MAFINIMSDLGKHKKKMSQTCWLTGLKNELMVSSSTEFPILGQIKFTILSRKFGY
jgi:hypothetical protein